MSAETTQGEVAVRIETEQVPVYIGFLHLSRFIETTVPDGSPVYVAATTTAAGSADGEMVRRVWEVQVARVEGRVVRYARVRVGEAIYVFGHPFGAEDEVQRLEAICEVERLREQVVAALEARDVRVEEAVINLPAECRTYCVNDLTKGDDQ